MTECLLLSYIQFFKIFQIMSVDIMKDSQSFFVSQVPFFEKIFYDVRTRQQIISTSAPENADSNSFELQELEKIILLECRKWNEVLAVVG